jgi:DNA-binding FadR family transcriptional regulator
LPEIDREDPRRVYEQIADHLEERIRSGDLAPDRMLPLMQACLGAARTTIRWAIAALRERGLVVTRP